MESEWGRRTIAATEVVAQRMKEINTDALSMADGLEEKGSCNGRREGELDVRVLT